MQSFTTITKQNYKKKLSWNYYLNDMFVYIEAKTKHILIKNISFYSYFKIK